MANILRVIFPYQDHGQWMFDDASAGLVREPFVLGSDTLLDILTRDITDAANGVKTFFSDLPFPGATELVWVREEAGGNWYRCPALHDRTGWLCPALLRYFDTPPSRLFVKVEPQNP